MVFLEMRWNLGYILELKQECAFKTRVFQHHQDSCLVAMDTSGFSSRLGSAIGMTLEVRCDTNYPFPFATVILGFLSIFKRGQASSPFEALSSKCLSSCQRDVRPLVEMRRGLWLSLGSPQRI